MPATSPYFPHVHFLELALRATQIFLYRFCTGSVFRIALMNMGKKIQIKTQRTNRFRGPQTDLKKNIDFQ